MNFASSPTTPIFLFCGSLVVWAIYSAMFPKRPASIFLRRFQPTFLSITTLFIGMMMLEIVLNTAVSESVTKLREVQDRFERKQVGAALIGQALVELEGQIDRIKRGTPDATDFSVPAPLTEFEFLGTQTPESAALAYSLGRTFKRIAANIKGLDSFNERSESTSLTLDIGKIFEHFQNEVVKARESYEKLAYSETKK